MSCFHGLQAGEYFIETVLRGKGAEKKAQNILSQESASIPTKVPA